jgi:hypothetical protein
MQKKPKILNGFVYSAKISFMNIQKELIVRSSFRYVKNAFILIVFKLNFFRSRVFEDESEISE